MVQDGVLEGFHGVAREGFLRVARREASAGASQGGSDAKGCCWQRLSAQQPSCEHLFGCGTRRGAAGLVSYMTLAPCSQEQKVLQAF